MIGNIITITSVALTNSLKLWPVTLITAALCGWSLYSMYKHQDLKSKPFIYIILWFVISWLGLAMFTSEFQYSYGNPNPERETLLENIFCAFGFVLGLIGLVVVLLSKGRRIQMFAVYVSGLWFNLLVFFFGLFKISPLIK